MELVDIADIFTLASAQKPPGSALTIKSILRSMAEKYAGAREDFPPRKVIVHWSYILHTCSEVNITPSGVTELVGTYENIFPKNILHLYGTLPYVLEAIKITENVKDITTVQAHLAAISVVCIDAIKKGYR